MEYRNQSMHEIPGVDAERSYKNTPHYYKYPEVTLTLTDTVTNRNDHPCKEPFIFGSALRPNMKNAGITGF